MPNWAEGVIKIRGTRQEIRNFLANGLESVLDFGQQLASLSGEEFQSPKVDTKEDNCELYMRSPYGFYIKGTRRALIEGSIVWYFEDRHTEILTIDSFKQAWGESTEEFAKISKEFNVDIKIYTFECGMEFNQDIEIHKGKVIKNNVIKFDDYEWECIFPGLGG